MGRKAGNKRESVASSNRGDTSTLKPANNIQGSRRQTFILAGVVPSCVVAAFGLCFTSRRPMAKGGFTFQRPGGSVITFRAEERQREATERYAKCGFRVINATDFKWSQNAQPDEPFLIRNWIDAWPALEDWTPSRYEDFVNRYNLDSTSKNGIHPWNFSDGSPGCKACEWWRTSSPDGFNQPVSKYFDLWSHRIEAKSNVFTQPNAVVFDTSIACDNVRLKYDAATPLLLTQGCFNRHLALAALGTSHGFHVHGAAWSAQIFGFKSFYMLPPQSQQIEMARVPFGFNHDDSARGANSLCGYSPTSETVRKQLRVCVQGPGEVVYVPSHWWHGTCALDEVTISTGGGLKPP